MTDITTLHIDPNSFCVPARLEGATFPPDEITEMTYTIIKGVCHWSLYIASSTFNRSEKATCTGILSVTLPAFSIPYVVGAGLLVSSKDGAHKVTAVCLDGRTAQFMLNSEFISPSVASPANSDRWVMGINGSYSVA